MAYTKYSLTPANNNAAPPDGAPEGMLPSAVNDTMRDMMAQIRDCGDGIRGGTYTMTAPVITGGSINGTTTITTSGAISYTGTLTGGTGVVNLGSGQFYKDASGNIGINTTTPASTLAIASANNEGIYTTNGTQITKLFNSTSISAGGLWVTSNHALSLGTNNSSRIHITNAGDVGVNTTTPSAKLDVNVNYGSLVNTYASVIGGTDTGIAFSGIKVGFKNSNSLLDATSYPLQVFTNGNAYLTVGGNGNVGIGTSSPQTILHLGGATNKTIRLDSATGNAAFFGNFNTYTIMASNRNPNTGVFVDTGKASGSIFIDSNNGVSDILFNNTTTNNSAPVERMRLDSNGLLCVNTASNYSGLHSFYNTTGSEGIVAMRNSGATGVTWRIGPNSGGTFVVYNQSSAGVYIPSGSTQWYANSDERLKSSLQPFENAVEKVSSLRAGTGRYLSDDESVSRSFLIAQDVQKVLPEAVNIQSDEDKTLGLSYADIVPLLVASIKELKSIIDTQSERITALEAK